MMNGSNRPSWVRCKQRGGAVLVITIMLLAVTALIVVSIARHSLFQATSAKVSLNELQEKWAVASCQRYCLANGRTILNATNQAKFEFQIRLGGMQLSNQINDESAKLDVNSLYQLISNQELARTIREASTSSQLTVRLRPLNFANTESNRPSFETWGQVFEPRDSEFAGPLRVAAEDLTCWGHKLNYQTAKPEVVKSAVKSVAGSIMADRFVSELSENPDAALGNMLAAIEANDRQRQRLSQLLTDNSWATSAWIDVVGPEKTTSYFTVQQRPTDNISRYQSFQLQ